MNENAIRMGCVALGVALGFVVAKFRLESRAQEEIEAVRDYYRRAYSDKTETLEQVVEEIETEDEEPEETPEPIVEVIEAYSPTKEEYPIELLSFEEYNKNEYSWLQNMFMYYEESGRFVSEDLELADEELMAWALPLTEAAAEKGEDIIYLRNPNQDFEMEVQIMPGHHDQVIEYDG